MIWKWAHFFDKATCQWFLLSPSQFTGDFILTQLYFHSNENIVFSPSSKTHISPDSMFHFPYTGFSLNSFPLIPTLTHIDSPTQPSFAMSRAHICSIKKKVYRSSSGVKNSTRFGAQNVVVASANAGLWDELVACDSSNDIHVSPYRFPTNFFGQNVNQQYRLSSK